MTSLGNFYKVQFFGLNIWSTVNSVTAMSLQQTGALAEDPRSALPPNVRTVASKPRIVKDQAAERLPKRPRHCRTMFQKSAHWLF